jgi:hypothetical protein
MEIPWGRPEGQHLALLEGSALREPTRIAREVVALLNAEGGEVWVGAHRGGDRLVGVESIAQPEAAGRRLREELVDRIEPVLTDDEVEIAIVAAEPGRQLLHLRVRPEPGRRPYAARLREGGLAFVERRGATNLPMSWDRLRLLSSRVEVVRERGVSIEGGVDRALAHRLELPERGLALDLLPSTPIGLELDEAQWEAWATEEPGPGPLEAGWPFRYAAEVGVEPARWWATQGRHTLALTPSGGLSYRAPLEAMAASTPTSIDLDRLHGRATQILFLAAKVLAGNAWGATPILVDLVLRGARGWAVEARRAAWSSTAFPLGGARLLDRDWQADRPAVFRLEEIVGDPRRCAQRLLAALCRAEGLPEGALSV